MEADHPSQPAHGSNDGKIESNEYTSCVHDSSDISPLRRHRPPNIQDKFGGLANAQIIEVISPYNNLFKCLDIAIAAVITRQPPAEDFHLCSPYA